MTTGEPQPARPSDSLAPGTRCGITEAEWSERLETSEPLHQWGSCFLVDEGDTVWAFLRDVTGAARHTAARLDAAGSRRARAGVEAVDRAAREVADLLAAAQRRGRTTLDELRQQEEASAAYVRVAEELYRELLDAPGSGSGDAPSS